jgi:hypothetical protein
LQVEFHTFSWLDKGRSPHIEVVPDEVRRGSLGSNSGDWPATWEAHPAAQRPNAAVVRPAVTVRSSKILNTVNLSVAALQTEARCHRHLGVAIVQLTQGSWLTSIAYGLIMKHGKRASSAKQASSSGLGVSMTFASTQSPEQLQRHRSRAYLSSHIAPFPNFACSKPD